MYRTQHRPLLGGTKSAAKDTQARASTSAEPLGPLTFSCPDEVVLRIGRLFGEELLSDVTFVVQRDEESSPRRFPAHRSIVAAWSQPLQSMLCGSFQEGSSREVRLLDVEPAAFEVMLKLIYTGTAEITAETVLAILDVSVRFDVAPLVQFSVQFLQNHATSEHACRMLEVGVQYGLCKLVDKCIELIVTDDHILDSEDFNALSQAAVVEMAKHDAWNLHEDGIYDVLMRWAGTNAGDEEEKRRLSQPFLEHLRYPYMSVEKLKRLSATAEVPNNLVFEALFFKLNCADVEEERDDCDEGVSDPSERTALASQRHRPRPGSLLFSWVPTSRVTVSGDLRESARHTSSNGFTGVRGDRRMMHGCFSWTVEITETQSSWIFVGVVQADDPGDVAWRASGHMLYCLDTRCFHQGSGRNHPSGDRKIVSGDCIRVVLDCSQHTLAFGVNNETPMVLFHDLESTWYVPAVDLRDCGDKVRILSCRSESKAAATSSREAPTARRASAPEMRSRAWPEEVLLVSPAPSPQRIPTEVGEPEQELLAPPALQGPLGETSGLLAADLGQLAAIDAASHEAIPSPTAHAVSDVPAARRTVGGQNVVDVPQLAFATRPLQPRQCGSQGSVPAPAAATLAALGMSGDRRSWRPERGQGLFQPLSRSGSRARSSSHQRAQPGSQASHAEATRQREEIREAASPP